MLNRVSVDVPVRSQEGDVTDQLIAISVSTATPGASSAAVLASDLDRRWFQANPDRNHRIRPVIVGETPDAHPGDYVVVHQVRPGRRIRWPFIPHKPPPPGEAPEHIAKAVFDDIVEARGRPERGSLGQHRQPLA